MDLFGKKNEGLEVLPGLGFLDFDGHAFSLSLATASSLYIPGFQGKNQILFCSGNPVQKMRAACGNS
jgi:hypothetical protein